jgi:hypothetical protein
MSFVCVVMQKKKLTNSKSQNSLCTHMDDELGQNQILPQRITQKG